ncbi:MFS transporter [Terrabacter sp. 2YAF2]|uniref:MFS transporter n=1 Tax=Terrabacter sp. 2YAF2 TaxID=3233026 RepID=UPI003F989DA4
MAPRRAHPRPGRASDRSTAARHPPCAAHGQRTPLSLHALRGPWPAHAPEPARPAAPWAGAAGARLPAGASLRAVITSKPFLLLAAALTLSGFAMYAVVFGLIPLLTHRGATTSQAAWALGLGGLGQTLGRLVYAPLAARTSPRTRTAALIAAGGLTTALLAAIPGPLWLLTLTAMAAGTVRGTSPSCRPPPSPTGGAPTPTAGSLPLWPRPSPSPAPSPPGPGRP